MYVYFQLLVGVSECVCVCASLSIIQIKQHFGLRRQLGRYSWQRAVVGRVSECSVTVYPTALTLLLPTPFQPLHSAIGNAHLDRQTTRTQSRSGQSWDLHDWPISIRFGAYHAPTLIYCLENAYVCRQTHPHTHTHIQWSCMCAT